ncbi:MAG: HD domain-containing protein [Chloroflexi bacterium]|nr:HD domain-containing protein [Chloroflexota bacterium]
MGSLLRPLRRAGYRVRQVAWGLRSAIAPVDREAVRGLLSAAELALFDAMQPRDRAHAVRTLRWLDRAGGPGSAARREVRVAALLHDVGKGRLALWHRVAYVLLAALPGSPLDRLCRRGRGARDALWRLRHHDRLGGALLREAGSAPRVVDLVERHLTPATAARAAGDLDLAALIEADGNS